VCTVVCTAEEYLAIARGCLWSGNIPCAYEGDKLELGRVKKSDITHSVTIGCLYLF
jgi:hypothetical protein